MVHLNPTLTVSMSPDELAALFDWLTSVRNDPLAFTLGAYPWGVPGTVLESHTGPEPWARDLMARIKHGLLDLNTAIQEATASGHGIGKSATVAQLIMWAFCTFPDCRGVITANTETQLKTKTWAELGKWFNLSFFARDHFNLTATALFSRDPARAQTWRIDMIPWSEKNPAAFAGLHNKGKRILLVFDEASEIPDIIWETAEGALTDADTQILWLVFGNPTRNIGRFRECFLGGSHHEFWHCTQIDSRTVGITNKTRFAAWIRAYGPDSDFVRIRVLGQFPRRGLMEFFLADEIDAAMSPDREVYTDRNTPLALGCDVARYGLNNSVIFPRKGRDARSIPRETFNGLSTTEFSNRIYTTTTRLRPDGIFIDGGGVGGGVVDQCRNLRMFVYEVQFGSRDDISGVVFDTTGERYANKRAAMYGALRAWLRTGALPYDAQLKTAMLAIKYTFDVQDRIQLVKKEDILSDHPDVILDDLDALALTFGGPLTANDNAGGDYPHIDLVVTEYDPYDSERLLA